MAEEKKKGSSKFTLALIITCISVVVIGIIVIVIAFYVISRVGKNLDKSQGQSQTATTYSTYTNADWHFSVKYPSDYSKEESVNGDGATFKSPIGDIELRAFSVLANGHTASQYLDGIFSLAKSSMPLRTVTEIENTSSNLGDLPGNKRVWMYYTADTTNVEVRVAAVGGDNMYNVSMTSSYDNYVSHSNVMADLAASFKQTN